MEPRSWRDCVSAEASASALQRSRQVAHVRGSRGPSGDRRAVDVITHDVFMEALTNLEADIARKEAELVDLATER
jgi:hypothetical protein